ncbi:MAG: UDP-N-acetylmuramoyl-tripeptide--D-alanyl-D-alanine ligase [Pseudomonadota bacterium]
MMGTLSEAATNMNGELQGADAGFSGISTDTRSIANGELFFALQGPNFDGHDYVAKASKAGAAGAVVSRLLDDDIAQIRVDDTRKALGRLAAAWRNTKSPRVIGITGSNGKTTLKEMIAACLGATAPTLATAGNLNNDIGMPLMLARIEDEHEFAVFEMGANHAGEIEYLVSLANPEVVVLTNAGAAHLEGFGSIEGVARAKGEILQNAVRPRVAVLNADDAWFDYWSSLVTDIEMLSFGLGESADVRASDVSVLPDHSEFLLQTPEGEASISLPVVGIHNVRNACAAAAVALSLGLDIATIKAALESMAPVKGRLLPLRGINGSTLFDDTYNANPRSVAAAADFIASLPGDSWLVLGDMFELGEDAEDLHREVGASARASGVSRLLALGDLCKAAVDGFGDGAVWFASIDALIAEVTNVTAGTNVLVKGSRGMRMERVVAALQAGEDVA